MYKNIEVVKMLLGYEPNLFLENNEGERPLDLAIQAQEVNNATEQVDDLANLDVASLVYSCMIWVHNKVKFKVKRNQLKLKGESDPQTDSYEMDLNFIGPWFENQEKIHKLPSKHIREILQAILYENVDKLMFMLDYEENISVEDAYDESIKESKFQVLQALTYL
jgi:ankyrin repeat protein